MSSTSKLQNSIKQIGYQYEILKKCDQPNHRSLLCTLILEMCAQADKEIDKSGDPQEIFKCRKQVATVRDKVMQLVAQVKPHGDADKESNISGKQMGVTTVQNNEVPQLTQQEKQQKLIRTIAFNELCLKQEKPPLSQIEEVAKKMSQNLAVMQQIQAMLKDQGDNLVELQTNLSKVYETTLETNKELEEAKLIQLRRRLRKIRMGVAGVLGLIGGFFLGLPGAVVGVVGGLTAPKN